MGPGSLFSNGSLCFFRFSLLRRLAWNVRFSPEARLAWLDGFSLRGRLKRLAPSVRFSLNCSGSLFVSWFSHHQRLAQLVWFTSRHVGSPHDSGSPSHSWLLSTPAQFGSLGTQGSLSLIGSLRIYRLACVVWFSRNNRLASPIRFTSDSTGSLRSVGSLPSPGSLFELGSLHVVG